RKKLEFENAAFGSIGLESAFGALNKLFGTDKAIALLISGRQRFGLDVPELKEGQPANLTLFEAASEFKFKKEHIASTAKNSMFIGAELKGKVIGALAHNHLILS